MLGDAQGQLNRMLVIAVRQIRLRLADWLRHLARIDLFQAGRRGINRQGTVLLNGNLAGFPVHVQHPDRLKIKLRSLLGDGNLLIVRRGERAIPQRFGMQHNGPLNRAVLARLGGFTPFLDAVSFHPQTI